MWSTVLHIIVTALLIATYASEGMLPCAESIYMHCADEQMCGTDHAGHSHADVHHENDQHSKDCHTHQCSCPCHMAGVEFALYTPVVEEYTVLSYPPPVCSPPVAVPLAPDHIPLAS